VDVYVLISVGIALLVVFVTIIYWALRARSRKRRTVLLVGLSNAGKTLLFSKLIYRQNVSTQTSIQENSAEYSVNNKKKAVRLIDLPGNDKQRHQFLDKFKSSARGIVIVIDSVTFQKEIKDVAELVYLLLVDKTIGQTAPAILIACNKQDQALAKGTKLIQSALEKELNAARISKSASLAATDSSHKSDVVFLGKRGQDFTFSDVKQHRVEFIECSARGSKDDNVVGVDVVEDWIARIA